MKLLDITLDPCRCESIRTAGLAWDIITTTAFASIWQHSPTAYTCHNAWTYCLESAYGPKSSSWFNSSFWLTTIRKVTCTSNAYENWGQWQVLHFKKNMLTFDTALQVPFCQWMGAACWLAGSIQECSQQWSLRMQQVLTSWRILTGLLPQIPCWAFRTSKKV